MWFSLTCTPCFSRTWILLKEIWPCAFLSHRYNNIWIQINCKNIPLNTNMTKTKFGIAKQQLRNHLGEDQCFPWQICQLQSTNTKQSHPTNLTRVVDGATSNVSSSSCTSSIPCTPLNSTFFSEREKPRGPSTNQGQTCNTLKSQALSCARMSMKLVLDFSTQEENKVCSFMMAFLGSNHVEHI